MRNFATSLVRLKFFLTKLASLIATVVVISVTFRSAYKTAVSSTLLSTSHPFVSSFDISSVSYYVHESSINF